MPPREWRLRMFSNESPGRADGSSVGSAYRFKTSICIVVANVPYSVA